MSPTLARKTRTPFFFTPLERDDHGTRFAKDAMDGGQGLKSWEPVNIPKLSRFWHRAIIAGFPREKQTHFPGNNQTEATVIGSIYPLWDAKSLKSRDC